MHLFTEMTTWPSHRNVFYRMSASGLTFEVKTSTSAAIGLAKKPGNECDVWVSKTKAAPCSIPMTRPMMTEKVHNL